MNVQDTPEKLPRSPRSRALAGLMPLTLVIAWLVLHILPNDRGPFHGVVQPVLTIVALSRLALLWFGVLRLPKNGSQA